MIKKLMSLGLCICFALVAGVFAKPIEAKAATTYTFANYYDENGVRTVAHGYSVTIVVGDIIIVGNKIYELIFSGYSFYFTEDFGFGK